MFVSSVFNDGRMVIGERKLENAPATLTLLRLCDRPGRAAYAYIYIQQPETKTPRGSLARTSALIEDAAGPVAVRPARLRAAAP